MVESEPSKDNQIQDNTNQELEQEYINDDQSIDEDEYLQELHHRLTQMKQERKAAEQDAQVLDNRLNMLKSEEDKTWKKIEMTKKKANEKLYYLQNMAEIIREREAIKQNRQEEIENKRIMNQRMKEEMRNNFEMRKAEKQKQILEEAKLLKLQKQYNEQVLAYLNNELLNNNKNKCESIKSQHTIEKEKKKILEKERKMKLKAELERKLLEEYRLKEEAEDKKMQVEQEEMEILKRLQTKTQIQKDSKPIFLIIKLLA